MTDQRAHRVMRWLTHDWHAGELTDEAYEAAFEAYQRHLSSLVPQLSADAQVLAQVNLHDGQVGECSFEAGRFDWRLLIGDLQRGYAWAEITYDEAELVGLDDLAPLEHDGRPMELVSDELDLAPDGRTEHRFYFWPENEFGVRFRSVRVNLAPASPDDRR